MDVASHVYGAEESVKPYDEAAACRMCGHAKVSTRFEDACTSPISDGVVRAERLVRTCDRCGFYWDEAPLLPMSIRGVPPDVDLSPHENS